MGIIHGAPQEMNVIQLLLLSGMAISLLLYLRFFRTVLRDRLIAILIFAVAITAILFPELTTVIANSLGVGRGADLLIYILTAGSIFAFVLIGTKLSAMEENITRLVRHIAICNAEHSKQALSNPSAVTPVHTESQEDQHTGAQHDEQT
jgi:hypothetical protein